jgi:SAM-dependent methyltransferase
VIEYEDPRSLEEHFVIAMDRNMDFLPTPSDDGGRYIQFGSGRKLIIGWENWDHPEWDAESGKSIPIPDGSVDGIACYHTLDHLSEPIRVLAEFQRIMRPGAWLVIVVPHYSSELWHTDLTHKSQFGIDTWRNVFSERHYTHNGVVVGHVDWRLKIQFNMLMGVTERNLVLVTQFLKEEGNADR